MAKVINKNLLLTVSTLVKNDSDEEILFESTDLNDLALQIQLLVSDMLRTQTVAKNYVVELEVIEED